MAARKLYDVMAELSKDRRQIEVCPVELAAQMVLKQTAQNQQLLMQRSRLLIRGVKMGRIGLIAAFTLLAGISVSQSSGAVESSQQQAAEQRSFDLYTPWRDRGETLNMVEKPENLYYVKLKHDGKQNWSVVEVTYKPPSVSQRNEEVLVISPRLGSVHPDWERNARNVAPTQRICRMSETKPGQPYSVCTSMFATLTTTNAILGFFAQSNPKAKNEELKQMYSFSEENFRAVLAKVDFQEQLRVAENEGAKYWRAQALKMVAEARAKAESEGQRREVAAAEFKSREAGEKTLYERVAKFPVGFRDACHTVGALYDGAAPPEDPQLSCQNIGQVSSLARLKAAGYIVTNVTRMGEAGGALGLGKVYTWQYSIERYNLPR